MTETDRRLREQLADIQRLAANGSSERLLRRRLEALLQNELKNLEMRNDMLLQSVRLLKDLHASTRTTLPGHGRGRRSGATVTGLHDPKERLTRQEKSTG